MSGLGFPFLSQSILSHIFQESVALKLDYQKGNGGMELFRTRVSLVNRGIRMFPDQGLNVK